MTNANNNFSALKALSQTEIQELMNLDPDAIIHVEAEEVPGHGLQARLHVLTDEPGHHVHEFFQSSTPVWSYDRAGQWQKLIRLYMAFK